MRKVVFLLTLFITSAAQAQVLDSNQVPVAVRNKLHVVYPHAKVISWAHSSGTLTGMVDGKSIERELSFKAAVADGEDGFLICFDSTGNWYQDNGKIPPPEIPIEPPTDAYNKVIDVMPYHKQLSWESNDMPYYHASYQADAFKNDSDEDIEYRCYFDSLWQYMGWSIELYNDTALIPVHAINTYVRKHYKNVEFTDATIDMDKDGAITQIEVILELKHGHYNMRILDFDGKGKLTKKPKKGIAYHGIDF